MIISKHRNGGLGTVELTFQKDFPRFMSYTRGRPLLMARLPRRPVRRLRVPLRRGDAGGASRAPAAGLLARKRRPPSPGGSRRRSGRSPSTVSRAVAAAHYPHVLREVRHYCDSISERIAAGRGMWFTGDFGTGKTTLAMLISKTAMEADHTVAIYSLPRLLAMLRETFREDAQLSLSQLVDKLCSVDLLHIDDVGAEQTSSWVLEQLYTVVNTRYEDRRSMILTTNLIAEQRRRPAHVPEEEWDARPDAELRAQIGDRTVSRLYEMCGDPLPMFGDDRRLESQFDLPDAGRPRPRTPDPFDDSRWEDDGPRYGQPRRSP